MMHFHRRHYIQALIAVTLFFGFTLNAFGAPPAAPSDTTVVPRYDAAISLVVSWTDNSFNEDGFRIQRREQGGAFADLGVVGINIITYTDSTATADKNWEYRVRATSAAEGDSGWTAASNDSSPKQVWPINDGDHDILHNMGTPLNAGVNYHHEAVDISASGKRVDISRGGLITGINNGAGGTLNINVDFSAAGVLGDSYLHVVTDAALSVGDPLAPGDRIGTVSTVQFALDNEADHVHWGSDARNNLIPFTANADRDPNLQAPVLGDINDDGEDFIIVDAAVNDHTNPRTYAWRDVDFLVDAYDDMSPDTNLMVAPFSLAYWIQAGVPRGENVASSAAPYMLVQFDFSLVNRLTHNTQAVYWNLPADIDGVNTWQTYLTWIMTNTSGTNGARANIDSTQFWRSDARTGSGARENRSDALRARENEEARFKDGTYFVRMILKDLVNTTNATRSVVVDNSRPYVKRVTVYSGASIVYQSQWVWNPASSQLTVQPATFNASAPFTALRTQDIKIEVEFSEPMQTAAVSAISGLGVLPTLTSTQVTYARTIWSGIISNLDIADDGSNDGNHIISFNGMDLAGNQLLQINNRNSMGADHHNRDAAGNMRGVAGADNIHGFIIGPLEGLIPVTAIFMKQGAADPAAPLIADKALLLQQALNDYFSEVSYSEISFAVTSVGWYQLDHPIDWYEADPRTPLIDLVQEAISDAEADGVSIADKNYILVVTDENAARPEWSTNGGWPYAVTPAPGWKLIAAGVLNLASTDPLVTNTAGRMIGLLDLFAYPEVVVARPFVGPWSHMSDKTSNVHVMGWEKWRAGWLDETGTATGNTLTRVPKPTIAAPIVNQSYTLSRLDNDNNSGKMVAIQIGEGLHYTAEYRLRQNLDSALPDDGVVITKANNYINQGEGTVIVQESPTTAGNLSDATFNTSAARDEFNDVGSGVRIEVTSMDAAQAEIRLNYTVPPTENDVFVSPHTNRWKALDIWIDAPDLAGDFAADPLTLINANEKPVVGEVNRVYGRVRNQGQADATNFEVHLGIRTPWGAGGPWDSLNIDTVILLQGQDNDPNANYIISGEWTPATDEHSCVKLSVVSIANDVNSENNWTQENIDEFVSTPGSPYQPIISQFEVENPYDEQVPVFFKIDGLPESWSYIMSPERLLIPAKGTGSAQVIIQPNEATPLCSRESITISAYTPCVDTLKRLGGITLQTVLKNPAGITMKSWTDCGPDKNREDIKLSKQYDRKSDECAIYTQGCTDPKLPNTQVAVVYTSPGGDKQVRYVTTDENGCYLDVLSSADAGLWEARAVLEETDCRAEAGTPKQPVDVDDSRPFDGSVFCYFIWAVFILFLVITIILIFVSLRGINDLWNYAIVAVIVTISLAYYLIKTCHMDACFLWLIIAIGALIACFIMYNKKFSPSFGTDKKSSSSSK